VAQEVNRITRLLIARKEKMFKKEIYSRLRPMLREEKERIRNAGVLRDSMKVTKVRLEHRSDSVGVGWMKGVDVCVSQVPTKQQFSKLSDMNMRRRVGLEVRKRQINEWTVQKILPEATLHYEKVCVCAGCCVGFRMFCCGRENDVCAVCCVQILAYVDRCVGERTQTMDLSHKLLSTVPISVCACASLTSLDMYRNYLATVPASISRLTNLKSLYLSKNNITHLPPEVGMLVSLCVEVDLSVNQVCMTICKTMCVLVCVCVWVTLGQLVILISNSPKRRRFATVSMQDPNSTYATQHVISPGPVVVVEREVFVYVACFTSCVRTAEETSRGDHVPNRASSVGHCLQQSRGTTEGDWEYGVAHGAGTSTPHRLNKRKAWCRCVAKVHSIAKQRVLSDRTMTAYYAAMRADRQQQSASRTPILHRTTHVPAHLVPRQQQDCQSAAVDQRLAEADPGGVAEQSVDGLTEGACMFVDHTESQGAYSGIL